MQSRKATSSRAEQKGRWMRPQPAPRNCKTIFLTLSGRRRRNRVEPAAANVAPGRPRLEKRNRLVDRVTMPASKRSSGRSKNTNGSGSRSGGRNAVSRAKDASRLSSQQLEGREPSHDPDVFVDIEKVNVDEIYVDVEQLEAHLALRAKLANLLQVVAGVHVHLGKVEVDIKGVEVQARLKVRLENLYDILDRALTTLDRNPEILDSLAKTLDDTVGDVGEIGAKALGPGGAASQAVGGLTNAAGQALGPGGAVGQLAGQAGQAL